MLLLNFNSRTKSTMADAGNGDAAAGVPSSAQNAAGSPAVARTEASNSSNQGIIAVLSDPVDVIIDKLLR